MLPLPIAVRTEGGGGGITFDLFIRSGPRDISSRAGGVTVAVSGCTTPDPVPVPVPVPVAPPDTWETMVRLWLLLNPVSFHFSETNLNRDLVGSSGEEWKSKLHTCSTAGSIGLPEREEQAGRLAEHHRLVGLPVLLVHDHIDDGIDAGREVEEDVAADVQTGMLHVLVGHLDNGDRQVADHKREEYGQDHLGDAPLVPLGPHLTLILHPGGRLFLAAGSGAAAGRRLRHVRGEAAAAVRGDAIPRLAIRWRHTRGQRSSSRSGGQWTEIVRYGVLFRGMSLQPLLGLVDHPEDLGIAGDDHQAGYHEGGDEERRLAAVSMPVAHNGAGLEAGIIPEPAPGAQQRGQLHSVGEEPAGGDHHGDPVAFIDPGIVAVVGDHHIPIDCDHGDAEQRDTDIPVLDEGYQPAEDLPVTPSTLDEAQALEGQDQSTEEQISDTEAKEVGNILFIFFSETICEAATCLIIKAAATLRTLGHFKSATTVSRLPQIPTIIIRKVITAAKIIKGWEKLKSGVHK